MVQVLSSLCNFPIARADKCAKLLWWYFSPRDLINLKIWELGHQRLCRSGNYREVIQPASWLRWWIWVLWSVGPKAETVGDSFRILGCNVHLSFWVMAICCADGLWAGLPYSRRRKVPSTYLYRYFSKTQRILRLRSEFRQIRSKPHGWEKSLSVFHVGSEVIQSLANKCFYTFLLKYLQHYAINSKQSFPARPDHSSNRWCKLHLTRELLLFFCFLFLDPMRFLHLTIPRSPLLFCLSAFLFQATRQFLTGAVGEDDGSLLNFIRLRPYSFSRVPFILLTLWAPNMPLDSCSPFSPKKLHGSGRREMSPRRRYHGDRSSEHQHWPLESNWAQPVDIDQAPTVHRALW